MAKVELLLAALMQEIPHILAADCVSLATGMSVTGGTSMDRQVDPSLASTSYVEVIEANGRALDMLGVASDTVEDIVVTASGVQILLYPAGKSHYVSVIITRRGSLKMVREALAKHKDELLAALADAE